MSQFAFKNNSIFWQKFLKILVPDKISPHEKKEKK